MTQSLRSTDYLFEVSWEICNKVGGINTVIATKSNELVSKYGDNFILIGPDIWREPETNPAFEEDPDLYKSWKNAARAEGLRIRIGRWKIVGKPIAVLLDFSPFIQQKDEIFSSLWEKYKLDSLSGYHDYAEAAIFGYIAGKLIDHFWKFNLSVRDKVIAHFHEWMAGAGILYLKYYSPQIATVFTTHATVTGRSIAGNGQPLYKELLAYNGDGKAKELGVVAKHSLEKIAANTSDCFTTVSEITAKECEQLLGRKIDVVTPNGFVDSFVPQNQEFEEKRKIARNKLFEVAEALLDCTLPKDTIFIANSGRYEFANKGIDIFIHSMGELNKQKNLKKTIVSYILVPANNYGFRRDLKKRMTEGKDVPVEKSYLTHGLHDSDYDPILNTIKYNNLKNNPEDKVKIIFVPSYLDNKDGIFDLDYYNVLIGFDLTIFPSYYEPWGYTPLESLAFHIPTVTTNLAGIGMWVNRELVKMSDGIDVFDRDCGIDKELIENIVKRVLSFSEKTLQDIQKARYNAFEISRLALWENLIDYYLKAYDIALEKVEHRSEKIGELAQQEQVVTKVKKVINHPIWKNLTVDISLPEVLKDLDSLSRNLWHSWNEEAIELFEYIDKKHWEKCEHNPILLLKAISFEKFEELQKDKVFIEKYNNVITSFKAYLDEPPAEKSPKIAYFSMEYGLHNSIKIYSGGLGVLAGDYLKQASDSNVKMTAIGFLYKFGYFTQKLSVHGEQIATYEPQNFSNIPVSLVQGKDGNEITVQVAFPGRVVSARIWKVDVGRIPLYLLDTDFEQNSYEDRRITHQLYGGDNEHRLKQEILLGVGGIRALSVLGITADIFHCNEGHAAMISIERLREYIFNNNFTFDESLEIVRSSTLFTTHTPVPAGHDVFPRDMVMGYLGHYSERLKTSWDRFISLWVMHPENEQEKFSMSILATNLSQELNGVSKLHGEVTRDMFKDMWEGYFPEELFIGYVTNGVHLQTWTAKAWKELYIKYFGKDFFVKESKEQWMKIHDVPAEEIWQIRNNQRKILIDHLKYRLRYHWVNRHINPKNIVTVSNRLNDKTLTIGFARRFATYKRAHLLFKDLDRLDKLVNNKEHPVQFIFAGKAHPADGGGQGLIKYITEISNRPEFLGKILFLENYDIELAKKMVQGVDIWMNTPTRPLEASGTSGMKAVMNGVLNFSVLDGWWVEGYLDNAGWSLPLESTYDNHEMQDELDAQMIYNIFENRIIPTFYEREDGDVPLEWVNYIKNCISGISPNFTTKRMITDYFDRFYNKLYKRTLEMRKDDYQLAKDLSKWKKKVTRGWESINVEYIDFPDTNKVPLFAGQKADVNVVLDLNELADIEVGIELLFVDNQINKGNRIIANIELDVVKKEGSKVYFNTKLNPTMPGLFTCGMRIYPKNELIAHKQDFPLLKWI